jgi:hypothetical protein
MGMNGEAYDIDSPGTDTRIDIRTAGAGDHSDAPAPAPETAVDLAGWGRGERDYSLDQVRLAIDERIIREIERIVDSRFVRLRTRRDAVEWLIKERLIEAADARTDV